MINVARGIDLSPSAIGGCYVKSLPGELQQAAAITAAELYPPNAPKLSSPLDALLRPLQAAGTRFWGPQPRTLIVRFTEASSPQLEQKIVQYLNAWKCTVSFALVSPSTLWCYRLTCSCALIQNPVQLMRSGRTWSWLLSLGLLKVMVAVMTQWWDSHKLAFYQVFTHGWR